MTAAGGVGVAVGVAVGDGLGVGDGGKVGVGVGDGVGDGDGDGVGVDVGLAVGEGLGDGVCQGDAPGHATIFFLPLTYTMHAGIGGVAVACATTAAVVRIIASSSGVESAHGSGARKHA